MTTSLAILYATFFAGLGFLITAWAWGDLPEHEYRFSGRPPIRPDLRSAVVIGESRVVRHTPAASLGHRA